MAPTTLHIFFCLPILCTLFLRQAQPLPVDYSSAQLSSSSNDTSDQPSEIVQQMSQQIKDDFTSLGTNPTAAQIFEVKLHQLKRKQVLLQEIHDKTEQELESIKNGQVKVEVFEWKNKRKEVIQAKQELDSAAADIDLFEWKLAIEKLRQANENNQSAEELEELKRQVERAKEKVSARRRNGVNISWHDMFDENQSGKVAQFAPMMAAGWLGPELSDDAELLLARHHSAHQHKQQTGSNIWLCLVLVAVAIVSLAVIAFLAFKLSKKRKNKKSISKSDDYPSLTNDNSNNTK